MPELADIIGSTDPNIWREFLEAEPRVAFEAIRPRGGPSQEDFWTQAFNQIYNQFLGQLGQQVLGGAAPSLSFTQFLQQFPFQQFQREQQGAERRYAASRLNPRTQFRF